MSASRVGGPVTMSMGQDDEGYREIQVTWLVKGTRCGPVEVLTATGLPQPGDPWNFAMGAGGTAPYDTDPQCTCRKKMSVKRVKEDDYGGDSWHVGQTFSSKPSGRCREDGATNPLEQADKYSISCIKSTEEGIRDIGGTLITNSAHELIRGPQNEWPFSTMQVTVTQNVSDAQLDLLPLMIDTVNEVEMWGLPIRTIRLSDYSAQEGYYSKLISGSGTSAEYDTCAKYWQRRLVFDIRYRRRPLAPEFVVSGTGTDLQQFEYETWDRYILDEANKVLRGHWDTSPTSPTYKAWILDGSPDPDNPKDFIKAVDFFGNPTRLILNGHGVPYDATNSTTGTDDDYPGRIFVAYYGESDFTVLGIPLIFPG